MFTGYFDRCLKLRQLLMLVSIFFSGLLIDPFLIGLMQITKSLHSFPNGGHILHLILKHMLKLSLYIPALHLHGLPQLPMHMRNRPKHLLKRTKPQPHLKGLINRRGGLSQLLIHVRNFGDYPSCVLVVDYELVVEGLQLCEAALHVFHVELLLVHVFTRAGEGV